MSVFRQWFTSIGIAVGGDRSAQQLRVFKMQLRVRTHLAKCRPILAPGLVQDNPLAELYGNAVPTGFNGNVQALNRLKRQFRNDLINNQLNRLMAPELSETRDRKQILTGFSVKQPRKFYEFQSDAQGPADELTDM